MVDLNEQEIYKRLDEINRELKALIDSIELCEIEIEVAKTDGNGNTQRVELIKNRDLVRRKESLEIESRRLSGDLSLLRFQQREDKYKSKGLNKHCGSMLSRVFGW